MSSMLSLVARVIDLSWFCSITATSDSEGGRYLKEGSQQLEKAPRRKCRLERPASRLSASLSQ